MIKKILKWVVISVVALIVLIFITGCNSDIPKTEKVIQKVEQSEEVEKVIEKENQEVKQEEEKKIQSTIEPKIQPSLIPTIKPTIKPSVKIVVKKSNSGICHAPGTTYYSRTIHYTRYNSIDECLASGGRLPKK